MEKKQSSDLSRKKVGKKQGFFMGKVGKSRYFHEKSRKKVVLGRSSKIDFKSSRQKSTFDFRLRPTLNTNPLPNLGQVSTAQFGSSIHCPIWVKHPQPNLGQESTAQIGSSIHCPIWVQFPLPKLDPVSTAQFGSSFHCPIWVQEIYYSVEQSVETS